MPPIRLINHHHSACERTDVPPGTSGSACGHTGHKCPPPFRQSRGGRQRVTCVTKLARGARDRLPGRRFGRACPGWAVARGAAGRPGHNAAGTMRPGRRRNANPDHARHLAAARSTTTRFRFEQGRRFAERVRTLDGTNLEPSVRHYGRDCLTDQGTPDGAQRMPHGNVFIGGNQPMRRRISDNALG
jgi:hypothetical protein